MGFEIPGLIGLLILGLDIYAIIKIIESAATDAAKVLWVILILALPVIGFILWLIFGPSRPANLRSA